MVKTASHEQGAAGSGPIRVLAVDDQELRTSVYKAALADARGIDYRGWCTHPEALSGDENWLDYDVILLDLGVEPNLPSGARPAERPRRVDDQDMFSGFKVASRIRELHPTGPRPFIALITGYYRLPGVRERAARLRVVDGFFERRVYESDDGENLRRLVYAAAKGQVWIEGADEIPKPSYDEERELEKLLEGRTVTIGDKTDVHKALEDGRAKLELLGVSMEDYLDVPSHWSAADRRRFIDPVTKAVAEHFAIRYRDDGGFLGYRMTRPIVCKLFRRHYWTDKQ